MKFFDLIKGKHIQFKAYTFDEYMYPNDPKVTWRKSEELTLNGVVFDFYLGDGESIILNISGGYKILFSNLEDFLNFEFTILDNEI